MPHHPNFSQLHESINTLTTAFTELKASHDRFHESFLQTIQSLQTDHQALRNPTANPLLTSQIQHQSHPSPQLGLSDVDALSLAPIIPFKPITVTIQGFHPQRNPTDSGSVTVVEPSHETDGLAAETVTEVLGFNISLTCSQKDDPSRLATMLGNANSYYNCSHSDYGKDTQYCKHNLELRQQGLGSETGAEKQLSKPFVAMDARLWRWLRSHDDVITRSLDSCSYFVAGAKIFNLFSVVAVCFLETPWETPPLAKEKNRGEDQPWKRCCKRLRTCRRTGSPLSPSFLFFLVFGLLLSGLSISCCVNAGGLCMFGIFDTHVCHG